MTYFPVSKSTIREGWESAVADMKLARCLIGISCAVGILSADTDVFSQPANPVAPPPGKPVGRHSDLLLRLPQHASVRAGNIMFDQLGAESVPGHPEIFEKAVRKLRGRLMPPPGNAQPSQQEIDALVGWLENTLDESSKTHLAGHVPVQRLNRTEYANAVKDLLAVEIDPKEYLPAEIEVEGFSNIASALTVSPAFLEQYVNVARTVSRMAVGKPMPEVVSASFPPPRYRRPGWLCGRHAARHAGRHEVRVHVPGGRGVPHHDHGPRFRGLPARDRERDNGGRADRSHGSLPAKGRRRSGSRVRGSRRRRTGGSEAHGAVRQYPRAGQGRCARSRRDVHRALPGGNRRPGCRRLPV